MNGFHDVRFPLSIGLSARGGPERRTRIVTLNSGREERNAQWRDSRRRWDVAPGVRTLDDLAVLIRFFEARNGQLYAFRFSDPLDHKSCAPSDQPDALDQEIGFGDGVATAFALTKLYADEAGQWRRDIRLPLSDSVMAAIDGVATPVVIDEQGRIAFISPPPEGARITAGYRFDVPVRFDADRLDIQAEGAVAGRLTSVPVLEVRL